MDNNENEVINQPEEVKVERVYKNGFDKFLHSKLFKQLLIFVIVFTSTFVAFNATIESTFVDGNSMYPTLKNGDYGITYKLGFKIGSIKRFDIITFAYKEDTYIKRVIGLPGEIVEYTEGVLYIDGKVVEEDFLSEEYKMATAEKKGGSFTYELGKDEYYVMGDNRKVNCGNGNTYCSYDSRSFGAIEYSDIKSRGLTLIGKCGSVEDGKCYDRSFFWPKKVK
jgi:signal peptidase I